MASTQIWADTIRAEVCKDRRCRRQIYFAVIAKTGKWHPFNVRPVPLDAQLELDTTRERWTVDFATSHFIDCPGRINFRRTR